ncbi:MULTISPECIES: sigma-54 interaction domain-containing protein [Halomonadaceae]|uniref:AAA domain-containing protein n=1 Tax=Vreelandella halophila TaxID=86177 RepID=A0A9X4YDS1_9GAMM|nr:MULTISPECIES: sigma-54 dependent transcriptional regulator [Halomonas]MYL27300.1 AAA domain-containing protein [Halomonas utahensis]MYL75979.1 AAA domain-containing protein [Halomonas sp. 22501_18_FS]
MFSSDAFTLLGGESPALQAVLRSAALVAATDATALVTGESGTGKELLARGMHQASRRHAGPWIPVNCAALPSELVEAELFGYWKGAFTGADRNAPGYVHQAQNGTLFLDEIAELTLAGQAKLLRFLEQGECQRLGSGRAETLDVRIIAATHQDLSALAAQGRFRSDLFYRLNVIPLTLPPLRERDGDVRILLERFRLELAKTHGVSPPTFAQSALTRLARHAWPGNVRELRNLVERCVVLMPGRVLGAEDLPDEWLADSCVPEQHLGVYLPPEGVRLEDVEADLIRQALSRSGGNRTRAAALVGVTRDTFLYRLRKHGLIRSPD